MSQAVLEEKLEATPVRDKAATEFDDKGRDLLEPRKGTADDPRVKLVMDKQKLTELELIAKNPDFPQGLKQNALQKYLKENKIAVIEPRYGTTFKAFSAAMKAGNLELSQYKAAKVALEESVAYTKKLKAGEIAEPKEADLKDAYTKLFLEDKKK